jgi:hypothetical protein
VCGIIPVLSLSLDVYTTFLRFFALSCSPRYPQQHPATGRLFRGCLQQPEGALLLLDEGQLSAGQLGDNGVKNLQVRVSMWW